jgi:heat shock protein HslJ
MFSVRQLAPLVTLLSVLPAVVSAPAHSQQPATTWVLQKAPSIPSSPSRTPQLRMEGEKMSGSTGCNAFTAKVSQRADKRVTIEQVALTRMLCAPEQNKIETALVRALEQTQFIETQGTRMSFLSAQRQPLLVWARSERFAANQPIGQ